MRTNRRNEAGGAKIAFPEASKTITAMALKTLAFDAFGGKSPELDTMSTVSGCIQSIAGSINGILISEVADGDSPIIYANQALKNLTGYTEAEVLGKDCRFVAERQSRPGGRLRSS